MPPKADEARFEALLTQALRRGLITDEKSIERMRQHIASGKFTHDHYINMWTERLAEPDEAPGKSPNKSAQSPDAAKADAKAKREQQLLERQAKAQADRDKVRAEKKAKAERAAQPKAAPEDRQQKQPKQPTQSKQAKQTKQAPPKETKTERTERLCQQMFDKFDKDGDGYHNFKETQAVVKALQGVGDHVDTDVDEAEYKHFCTDLGADPKRGVNLRQFTTVYTDKSFGANFDLDYKHVFGVDPEEQRKADERKAKSERARQEAEAEVEAERKAKVKREKAREERDPKAKADREAAAKVRAEKKAAYEAKATAEADAKAKAEAEDIAKMAAAKESALKELGLPRTPANSMPLPSDAIILRRFYTHHAVGKASAEEWGAQSWSHAQWAEKIGRIIGSYRRKVTKRAENKGIAVTEDDCRQAMFADYIKLKGVDLPAWVGTWEQLGITPSTSTRYKAMTPHRHTAPESTPMADDNVSVHSDRSAVDPEVLAAAKAKAAEDARQRRLAFLESKAASVSVSGTTRSGKTIERVSDWVHTSPVPRGMDQSHGLEVFTADDFETGELMEDFQAASEEAEVQRQGELAHRQLIGTRAAFARADTDGDGVVSAEELLEWFAAEMAVTNIEASDDQQDWLKPWQKRIGATIMEAPAIGSSGNVGVAVEGFSKLRARRLKELNEELQEAREGFEVVRRKHLTLQERTARARALSGITKQRSPTKNGGASPPMRPRGAVRSVDASSSADAVHRVISELTRLRIGIATLDEQNTSMQETLQVIEQLSPSSTRVGAQELEPEPELVSESVAEDPDKPQSKMLPAQIHMMAHCELMVAEHLLNPAGAYSLKGHLREHSLKVANMLRRWQPIPTALAVASTAVLHMDLHYKQCLSENAHAPPTSSAAHELKELCDAHAVRIAEAARGRPKAATAIVVRFTEPGPIGVALSSEHPFDAAWKQADVNGDGQLSRREVVHLLRVMGRLDDHSKASVVEQYTTQVLHELDPTGKGVIGAEEFQRWHEAQPRQEMARVRVESCGLVAARQGLQEGFYLLAVNDVDVRDKSIRDITSFIRSAGRPLTMEFGFAEGAPAVSQKPPIQSPPDAMTSSSFDSEILLMTLKGDVNDIKASGEETSFRASFQQQLGSVVGLAEVSRIQIKSLLAPGLTVKFSFSPSASGAPAATLMKKLALMASDGSLAAAIPDYVPGSFKAAVPAVKMELVPAPVPPKPALRTMTLIFGKDEDLGLVLGRHDPLDKNWYVESVSDYAASRGIRVGAKLVSVQGTDVRETPLHEVMEVIKVAREGVKSGKAMKMVIERLDDSHVPTRAPAAPASLLTVTLKKDKKQKDMSHGSYGMVLTPKLRVESLPPSSSGKKRKPGPAEKAGVKVGYILVSINGTKVTSIADVGAIFSKAGKLAIDCTFEQVGPAPARSASPSTSLPAGAELEYSNSAHCTVHIGGLGTYLPQPDETLAEATKEQCEAELRQHFERFGEILTCNARLRHKMEDVDGVPTLKESWALISYHLSSEALAAVQGVTALNTPHWPNLVARMVDTNQVQSSTGGMAQVMTEKHEEEERALVSKLKAMLSPRSRAKLENEQGDKKGAKKRAKEAQQAKKAQQKVEWAETKGTIKARMAKEREAEEAPFLASAAADEEQFKLDADAAAEQAEADRETEARERKAEIAELKRAEEAASRFAAGKLAVETEKKQVHRSVVERLRPLEATLKAAEKAVAAAEKAVAASKKGLISAEKTDDGDSIATAEANLESKVELQDIREQEAEAAKEEVEPVAEEERVAKAEWEAAASANKEASAKASAAAKALQTAERNDLRLTKQAEKDAVTAKKKQVADKTARERKRASDASAREKARVKQYKAAKKVEREKAAAILKKEKQDVVEAQKRLADAVASGDTAAQREAEAALALEIQEAEEAELRAADLNRESMSSPGSRGEDSP